MGRSGGSATEPLRADNFQLRADNERMRRHQDTEHPGCPSGCDFRRESEWLDLFALLGLRVVSRDAPARDCLWFYQIPRAFFELALG